MNQCFTITFIHSMIVTSKSNSEVKVRWKATEWPTNILFFFLPPSQKTCEMPMKRSGVEVCPFKMFRVSIQKVYSK